MANPNIIFSPYSGYSVPVVSVYSDQTSLLTSSNASRQNYNVLTDVYINGNDVATLKSYPLNGVMQANPAKTAENYLLHDFNYNCVGLQDNPDSIKRISTVNGESFSRVISFSSITNTFGAATLNLVAPSTTLRVNDRIYINLDNTTVNPQYNTYAKVLNITGNQIETDLTFVSTIFNETGTISEGIEFYDQSDISGELGILTTNPHNLHVGDTVFIQMDTVSTGKFQFNAGTTGHISAINIGSTNILLLPVSFNTSINQTINDIVTEINANWTVTGFLAYHWGTSNLFHVYSTRQTGQSTDGLSITITATGNINITSSPAMFDDNRIDSTTGEGWNPQFTGTYPVTKVISSTEFVAPVPQGFNNEPGSQRGSIMGANNYVYTGTTTGQTYWIMNNNNRYDYDDYASEIEKYTVNTQASKFLTNNQVLPYTPSELNYSLQNQFYLTNDIATVDILVNPSTSPAVNYMLVVTFSGNNVNAGTYLIDLTGYTSDFTTSTDWKRYSFGVGAWNLNQIPSSSYDIITAPRAGGMITDNINAYTVMILSGLTYLDLRLDAITEAVVFTRACTPYKYFQLIWLNKWGAYDYYPITGNYEDTVNVTRTQFERKRESVLADGTYGYRPIDRGYTDFNIKSTKTVVLNSDWLNLHQAEWIAEVFESPQVYLYEPHTGNPNAPTALYPINIMDTKVVKPNERSRMKAYTINVQISSRRINQKN